jgi:hypothetical protein
VVLSELYEVLVHVEHDTDRDNQYDRVDVRADELAYDIPVENADIVKWVYHVQDTEKAQLVA